MVSKELSKMNHHDHIRITDICSGMMKTNLGTIGKGYYGKPKHGRPITVTNTITGESKKYMSATEAGETINESKHYLAKCGKRSADSGKVIKYKHWEIKA